MKQSYLQIDYEAMAADGLSVTRLQKYLTGILTLPVCAVLVLYLWSKIPWSEMLPVNNVQIAGHFGYLSPAELEKKVADIISGGLITVNIAGIKQELLQEEWLSEVAVRRVWPDSLMISITEHKPVALWGSQALLSNKAVIFSPAEVLPTELPFLSGPQGSEQVVLRKYEYLQAALNRWGREVEMLVLTERRAWQFKLTDGPLVLLGRKDVEARFERFFNFVIPYQPDSLLQAKSIDMRYTNGFAVKWNADSKTDVSGVGGYE